MDPLEVGTEEGTEDGVSVFRTALGAALVPRSVGRLPGHLLDLVAEIQHQVLEIQERQEGLEDLVRQARAEGLSWNVVGWSVGTSAQAARKRWGGEGE